MCCVSLTLMLFAAAVVFIYSSIMKRRPKSTPKSKCIVMYNSESGSVDSGVFLAFLSALPRLYMHFGFIICDPGAQNQS